MMPGFDVDAIESGLADYLAASFLQTPIIGKDLGRLFQLPTPYIRTLDNNQTFDGVGRDKFGNHHKVGETWGGALWACRKNARKQIDETVLTAWRAANAGASDSASKRFGAVLAAAPAPAGACLADEIAKRGLPH
jgi:hypothetical protein